MIAYLQLSLASIVLTLLISAACAESELSRRIRSIGEDRDVESVIKYVRQLNGYTAPFLEPRKTATAGWGLFFTANASAKIIGPANPYIAARIHRDLLICNDTTEINMVKRLAEALLNNYSKYEPVFRSWPKPETLIWDDWSSEDLEQLENTALVERFLELRKKKLKEYNELKRHFGDLIDFDDYKALEFFVESRVFDVEGWNCLVPFADIPNHNITGSIGGRSWWAWDKDDTGVYYLLTSEVIPQPQQEYTIMYNENLTNEHMLVGYGFASIDNPHQRFDWHLSQRTELYEEKVKSFPKVVLIYDVDIEWLLILGRVSAATVDEFYLARQENFQMFFRPISLKREIDAAATCYRDLRHVRPIETLLRDEVAYYTNFRLSSKQRTALAYRTAYSRVVERNALYCLALSEYLKCITSYKFKRMWNTRLGTNVPKELQRLTRNLFRGGIDAICR